MGEQTAFWEAVIAVAPLLALTILVEYRSIQWQRVPVAVRIVLGIYLCSSIVLLGSCVMFAIVKLASWGHGRPDAPWDVPLMIFTVIYAVAGVMLVPVSITLTAMIGPALRRDYRALKRLVRVAKRDHRRRLHETQTLRNETMIELTERVVSNRGDLFTRPTGDARPQLSDSRVRELLDEAAKAMATITEHQVAYRKLEKKLKRKLKRLQKRHPIKSTTDYVYFISK